MPKNYLITGLPRSGTTLLTSLLSKNIDAVTFSEPEWLKEVRKKSNNCMEFAQEFANRISSLRNDIRTGKSVYIKASRFNQGLPQNYYHRNEKNDIIVDKDESPVIFPKEYADMPFIIKANAQFTACLDELVKHKDYKIICVVRDPIATIMSWRSLDIPVSRGNMKIAETYHSNFDSETKSDNLLKKQVLILDWFFKQFNCYRNEINLVKYESMVEHTMITISNILDRPIDNITQLKSKNNNIFYNLKEKSIIKAMLQTTGKYYKEFYTI